MLILNTLLIGVESTKTPAVAREPHVPAMEINNQV
jgi:hypothetical protein